MGKKVSFYAGCLIDFVYPELGKDIYKVLEHEGCEMFFPWEQACCGAPAKYIGDTESQIKLAKQNITALEENDPDYVVCACPTCTGALRDDFPELFKDDPEWLARAQNLAGKIRDFTDLVVELREQNGTLSPEGTGLLKGDVTYHDSCHYKRHLHLSDRPRKALKSIGMNLKEMKDSDMCCGMAGSYLVKFPEISGPILKNKVQNICNTQAKTVAVDCPGCLMQITGGMDKVDRSVTIKHTATLLAEELELRKKA